jgi:proteasome lid subunit RPN8/RPN11
MAGPAIAGLSEVAEATIYPHVFAHADREVGGVLIGQAVNAGDLPVITGAIAALSADEQRATLTFTQDAWEHVHRTLDRDFPDDQQIVGWYHSHPSFGIFLSEPDLFIHRNFFNGPSQIALVVDPIAKTEGVFAWRGEDIAQLYEHSTPARWIATSERGSLPLRRHSGSAPDARAAERAPSIVALLVAALIGLGVGFGVWEIAVRPPSTVKTSSTSRAHRPAASAPALTPAGQSQPLQHRKPRSK